MRNNSFIRRKRVFTKAFFIAMEHIRHYYFELTESEA